jgi:hypothetical protein
MPYAHIDFEDLVKQVSDEQLRLAAIQVHDDMYLAVASLTKLFGAEAVTPERVFTIVELVQAKREYLIGSVK